MKKREKAEKFTLHYLCARLSEKPKSGMYMMDDGTCNDVFTDAINH
jgi:hypothetical protein